MPPITLVESSASVLAYRASRNSLRELSLAHSAHCTTAQNTGNPSNTDAATRHLCADSYPHHSAPSLTRAEQQQIAWLTRIFTEVDSLAASREQTDDISERESFIGET